MEARDFCVSGTVVERISHRVASDFIREYEWLGNIGSAQQCFGLYADGELLSVACFTRVVAPGGFLRLLPEVPRSKVYQLCRGASSPVAPRWAGSRVISGALRLLRVGGDVDLVFAYADSRAGEIGVVYQAANAFYIGMTDARGPGEYIINGDVMNPRSVFRRFGSAAHETLMSVDPNYQRIQRVKKHRYVFIVPRGLRRRRLLKMIAPLIASPPKRPLEGSSGDARVDGGCSGSHDIDRQARFSIAAS